MSLTGVIVAGVVVVIVPPLTLTTGQLTKLRGANQHHSQVFAHHVDECSKSFVRNTLILTIRGLSDDTPATVFLLCSPQYLDEETAFRDAILHCAENGPLGMVVIDEAHMYAMHGRSFRTSIRRLSSSFFETLYGHDGYQPLLFLANATMTTQLLGDLSSLTCVDWNATTPSNPWSPKLYQ